MKKKFQIAIIVLMTLAGVGAILINGWYWTGIITFLIVLVCSDVVFDQ